MIKLYHGTNVEFDQLDPSLSREGLDFGKGSYENRPGKPTNSFVG